MCSELAAVASGIASGVVTMGYLCMEKNNSKIIKNFGNIMFLGTLFGSCIGVILMKTSSSSLSGRDIFKIVGGGLLGGLLVGARMSPINFTFFALNCAKNLLPSGTRIMYEYTNFGSRISIF